MKWRAGKDLEQSEWIQESIRLMSKLQVDAFQRMIESISDALKLYALPLKEQSVMERLEQFNEKTVFVVSGAFEAVAMAMLEIYTAAIKEELLVSCDCIPQSKRTKNAIRMFIREETIY